MNNISLQKNSFSSVIDERLNVFFENLIQKNKNGKHLVQGKTPQKNAIILQTNDYLSLSQHPEIKLKHKRAIDKKDDSAVMSRIFLQNEELKPEFEVKMAQFMKKEACLLSQSGWSANIGLLQTICAPNCVVYIDMFAHMSLWQGAREARAQIHGFKHNSIKHLRQKIKRHGQGLIIIDSVYSSIGTVAPLEAICQLAQETGCALLVDESHSLGTHGPQGAGLVSQLGLSDQVDFITSSLAKSFAYRAGVILGPKKLSQVLPFVSFPAIFSSGILPQEIARLEATLDVIRAGDKQREKLFFQASKLRNGLKKIGFPIQSESQIIALECGKERDTELVRDFFEDRNVFGSVFCCPATAKNKSILRFTVNSEITDENIEYILDVSQAAFADPTLAFIWR